MLSAISSCQDLDPFKFSWNIHFILEDSAKLPQAAFEGVHNELQGALAAVAEYFGRPDAVALADHLTQDVLGWYSFWRLSNACVELAKVDRIMLFSSEIVDTIERFSSLCPNTDDNRDHIRDIMKTLRELTGLPAHPYVSHRTSQQSPYSPMTCSEVIPAADSQPSSTTNS